jgi:hypothetical protein
VQRVTQDTHNGIRHRFRGGMRHNFTRQFIQFFFAVNILPEEFLINKYLDFFSQWLK